MTSDDGQAGRPTPPSGGSPRETPAAADGDGFDAIQRRVGDLRREALAKLEQAGAGTPASVRRGPTPPVPSLDRLRPPPPQVVAPAAPRSTDDWRREVLERSPVPDDESAPPERVQETPRERTVEPAADERPLPPDPSAVGRVLLIDELPPLDGDDREPPVGMPTAARARHAAGPVAVARDMIERIAVTRSLAVLAWQLMSVLVLAAMFAWVVWFPFAATGSDARALVVSDSRMAPTILRGDVVVVRDSPDLPYPLDTVVAIEQGGVLLTERIVGEDVTGPGRILLTRGDGVSIGADRRVRTDEVIGSVRRIHRLVGYPVLWFTQPAVTVQQLLVVLLVLSSTIGAVSLVVRWDLKRSDRALVSAIASGARTPQ